MQHTLLFPLKRAAAVRLACLMFACSPTWVAAQTVNLDRLLNANASDAKPVINPVRKAALDGAAITIGTQTGMIERANEIGRVIAKRAADLDQTFRFGDLVIGKGVLPPVIVRTDNAISVTDNSMRLAGTVYRLEQPARFFAGAPSWRDWLLMGLPVGQEVPTIPANEQLLPRDAKERQYWQHQVKIAYENGRAQADEIFRNNLGELVKTYNGMRTFYDLHQRKMVSAPYIASAQEIVTQDDPNMMVVGDTTFRITLPSQLNTDAKTWKAMPATPKAKPRLPVVKSTALEEAKRKKQEEQDKARAAQTVQVAPVKESAPIEQKPIAPTINEAAGPVNKSVPQKSAQSTSQNEPTKSTAQTKSAQTRTEAATPDTKPTAVASTSSASTPPQALGSEETAKPTAPVAQVYNPPPLFTR